MDRNTIRNRQTLIRSERMLNLFQEADTVQATFLDRNVVNIICY
jgi:hypothetical protein